MIISALYNRDDASDFSHQIGRRDEDGSPYCVLHADQNSAMLNLHFLTLDTLDLFIAAATMARREFSEAILDAPATVEAKG